MSPDLLLPALLMGLLGSTHCIGMCGGIVSSLNMGLTLQTPSYRFFLSLFYNLGRLTTYGLLGLVIGGFSAQLLKWLPDPHMFSRWVSGVFFILVGLYISQWHTGLRWFEKIGQPIWQKIEPLGRSYLPAQNIKSAYLLGMVWGWLPCGLVYSALALALSSGGVAQGGLTMLAFGLGTLPMLLIMGHLAHNLKQLLQIKWLRYALGVVLMAWGLLLITGWDIFSLHQGHAHHH